MNSSVLQKSSCSQQLSDFLKNCRARVTPSDLGLPDNRRRRSPGLRREDVAALSGVSVTWYTWLEQGRDVHVSDDVLERISGTFGLSPDERGYLFSLVQHRPPPLNSELPTATSPALKRVLHALGIPALIKNARWDVIAWNPLVTTIFRDYNALPESKRNLLRILFTEPDYRTDPEEFESMARRVLGKFRVDYSEAGPTPEFDNLITELEQVSPMFARIWREPDVSSRSHGVNRVRHPALGDLSFEHSSYVPEGHPLLRVVMFVPFDKATEKKLAALNDNPPPGKPRTRQ